MGKSVSFSAEDFISFLSLKKIDYSYMMEKVYKTLLADFKEPFKSTSKITPTVDIQEVVFNSRYLQPGKTVECIVRMVFSGPKPTFIGVEVEDNVEKTNTFN